LKTHGDKSTDKVLDFMRELATRHRERNPEKGDITYAVCCVCGYVRFEIGKPDEPPATRVKPMRASAGDCPDCAAIARRYPELAEWLARVLFIRDRTRPANTQERHDGP
jgi:hypothetical protein